MPSNGPSLLSANRAQADELTTIDAFLTNIAGEFGPFQWRHFALVVSAQATCGILTLSMVFTGRAPSYGPGVRANSSSPLQCAASTSQLVRTWESTTSEWALVCDDAFMAPLMGTLYFVGFGVGASFLGSLADRFGRLPCARRAAALCAVATLASALAPSPFFYLVCRALVGVGVGGLQASAYVLAAEMIGPSWQALTGTAQSAVFSIGALALAPLSLAVSSWRALTALTALAPLVQAVAFRGAHESPRWLHSQGHSLAAARLLQLIALENGADCPSPPRLAQPSAPSDAPPDALPDAPLDVPLDASPAASPHGGLGAGALDDDASSRLTEQPPMASSPAREAVGAPSSLPPFARASSGAPAAAAASVLDLYRSRVLRARTLAMVYCWFAVSFTYYGLALNAGNLGDSLHAQFALSISVDLPGYVACAHFLSRAGRRRTTAVGFTVGGISCAVCLLLPAGPWTVAAATVGKFFVTVAFGAVFVYAAEIFPTSLRTAALGLCSTGARVGGAAAPLAITLGAVAPWLPLGVFGLVALMAGVASAALLPETLGRPLAATVAECERRALPAILQG